MANTSHDDLIKSLELRFDYLSARTMSGALLAGAGVAKAASYDSKAVASIAAACEAVIGTGAEQVASALGAGSAPAVKATPVKEATADAPKADETPPAATKPAAAKPAKKAAAKGKKKK